MLLRKAKLRHLTRQRLSNVRKQQKIISIVLIFLFYEENLVPSNLNSKQLRFLGAHPSVHIKMTGSGVGLVWREIE